MSFQTYDQRTIDAAGAFFVGELERLDPRLHLPLYSTKYTRDFDLREDVTIADETSSFSNSSFAAAAGSQSVLSYLKDNTISMAENGQPLVINSSKWLTGAGASGKNRAMAYTKRQDLIRFPMVPLQRTPVQYDGLYQAVTYYGRAGVLEITNPTTVLYQDGQ